MTDFAWKATSYAIAADVMRPFVWDASVGQRMADRIAKALREARAEGRAEAFRDVLDKVLDLGMAPPPIWSAVRQYRRRVEALAKEAERG